MLQKRTTDSSLNKYFARVFFSEKYAGSNATLYYCHQQLSQKEMQRLAYKEASPVTCFIQASTLANEYLISFYNQTHEIKLCGHGLLASAHWLNNYILSNISKADCKYMPELKKLDAYKFVLPSGEKISLVEQAGIWLVFNTIATSNSVMPKWANDVFSELPQQASKVGGKDGYWIFEWRKELELFQLSVDFKKLSAVTNRAVIATQESLEQGFDYNLRYFAPQHGVSEDPATGSANRVLGAYWQQKCNFLENKQSKNHSFKALQKSATGAVINVRTEDESVWIGGQVSLKT